jgi:tetratricopeptide (TPR) repeat protein
VPAEARDSLGDAASWLGQRGNARCHSPGNLSQVSLPSDPTTLVDLARADLAGGRTADAQEKCLRVLATHHHHPGALDALGRVLHAQGREEEAVRVFNALTLIQPTVAVHWQNLGAVLRSNGRQAQSLAAFERALRLAPPTAGLLYNLGALHMDRLDYAAAQLALRDAVALAPRDARIRWTYAQCCYDMGQRQEAISTVADWETLEGLSVDIIVSIAVLLVTSGAAHLAQRAVQRLMANPPATGRAAVGFAFLLDRLHRLDEARAVMQQLEVDDRSLSADLERLAMWAVLADRSGRHEEAHRLLTTALQKQPEFVHRYNLLYPLARACDALGRYEEAYTAAAEAHRSQLAFLERVIGRASEEASQLWALTAKGCESADIVLWDSAASATQDSPIFVVGFPRSGTTLLEQVLDAHPLLQSMDEQPFLLQAVTKVTRLGISYPDELGKLSGGDLAAIRAQYWNSVRERAPLAANCRLVDKNPMNMVLLPIIYRLFPNAPIILVLRHPCDTVLSFFLQDFRSDLALLARDLTSLARCYSRAFSFWYAQCTLLQANTYELQYEQLAANFVIEIDRLCAFLQLSPHEAMLAPAEHARTKGFISTPSYAQVVEPVSERSVGRWKRYESHFHGDPLALLMPWIRRWGYSLS